MNPIQSKFQRLKPKVQKIGQPGYKVLKQKDPDTEQKSLLFEIFYPEITDKTKPKYRIMSAFEQKVEKADSKYQYLLIAAEPYETIAFKIPNIDVDFSEGKHFESWEKEHKKYTLQLFFKDMLGLKPKVN